MPSRADISFLHQMSWNCPRLKEMRVNALSGLYIISTEILKFQWLFCVFRVNALSGLYIISTQQ